MEKVEFLILRNLLHNEEYLRKVVPFLKSEYFEDEKQKIVYARLSLSDDPDAKEMKEKIMESAKSMGLPADVDVGKMFDQMSEVIDMMKRQTT